MYVFTEKLSLEALPTLTLALTADERTRSRYRYTLPGVITDADKGMSGEGAVLDIYLELSRGTSLRDGDCLGGDGHGQVLKIVAKPEEVLTVRAVESASMLLRAAYHLGNRHVALEVGADYLRLLPDPVLASMLHHLGATVVTETVPFQPESGAYGHHH